VGVVTLADMNRIVAYIQAAYPTVAIPDDTVKAYHHSLQNVDTTQVLLAVNDHMRRSRFMPSVAELLELVVERQLGMEPPEQAWLEVHRAISRWGRYRPWRFANAATDLAVEAIGKDVICNATDDTIGTVRAQWLRTYASLHRTEVEAAKQALAGGYPFRSVLAARQQTAIAVEEPPRLGDGERVGSGTIGEALLRVLPPDEPPEAA
jgi:hypothetical protein